MTNIGRQLINAQPSMAPIFSAVNRILLILDNNMKKGNSLSELKETVKNATQNLYSYSENAQKEIQKNVLVLIDDGVKILTHSYSSTVIKTLIYAHQNGKEMEVLVTESRPMFEGRKTAAILAKEGIKTTLLADMASFHIMEEIDMLVTGCDCVCQKGIVNKIGTKGLALAAFHDRKPMYVLTERSKFLPAKYRTEPLIETKDPKEIFGEARDFGIMNIYFDITPLGFINGLVTEDRTYKGDEIEDILDSQEVCYDLISG
jgi:translation initiation factor 2B subunit (eIF-2B alpha/beta/delta family)